MTSIPLQAYRVLSLLASHGASLSRTAPGGMSLLMRAAAFALPATLTLLVERCHGSISDVDQRGLTPLHYAITGLGGAPGRPSRTDLDVRRIVQILATHCADLRAPQANTGHTAVMLAAAGGLPETLAYMLQRCPEAVGDQDGNGWTVLHHAILGYEGSTGANKALLPPVARFVETALAAASKAHLLPVVHEPVAVERGDRSYLWTPLMLAADLGEMTVMELLLNSPPPPEVAPGGRGNHNPRVSSITTRTDELGRTALQLALEYYAKLGRGSGRRDEADALALHALQLMVMHGAAPAHADATGRTALMVAAGGGLRMTVEFILHWNQALVDDVDKSGRTPLHHAAQFAAGLAMMDHSTVAMMKALAAAMRETQERRKWSLEPRAPLAPGLWLFCPSPPKPSPPQEPLANKAPVPLPSPLRRASVNSMDATLNQQVRLALENRYVGRGYRSWLALTLWVFVV